MGKKHFSVISMVVLCLLAFSNVNAKSPVDDKESVKLFVQKFYDWYIVLYSKDMSKRKDQSPSDIIAIKQKKECFAVSLSNAIIADNRESAKITDEIAGLDFDPFLNTQDTGFAYQTGNVKQVGNKFFVDVHSGESKKSKAAVLRSEIAVIAEVVKINDHWTFTNFIYPSKDGKSDLITILKKLQKGRNKNTK